MKLTVKDMEGLGLIKRHGMLYTNASFDATGAHIVREDGRVERWLVCWDYERNCEAYHPKEPYDNKVRR